MSEFLIENGVLKKYTGEGGVVRIPDGVESFAWNALHGKVQLLTEVYLPGSVKVLTDKLFCNATNLQKVVFLEEGLEVVGSQCFAGCTSLQELRLPDTVRQLNITFTGDSTEMFKGCTQLLRKEGNCLFAGDVLVQYRVNPKDTEIVIPEGTRLIMSGVFGKEMEKRTNCANVRSVTLPEGVLMLGGYCLQDLPITELHLPASLKRLGDRAIYHLPKLQTVDLRHTAVTVIPESCICFCDSLQEILLPEGLEEVRDGAFQGNLQLKHIDFPASVKRFLFDNRYGSGCLQCSGITRLQIPEGVEELPACFCMQCGKLEEVVLPASLQVIGSNAFKDCINLTKVVIPKDGVLRQIGEDAFFTSGSLARFPLNDSLAEKADEAFWNRIGFGDENGCVAEKGTLTKYTGSKKKIVITEGIAVIPEGILFPSWEGEVSLPDSVKEIKDDFLANCKVNIPRGYLRSRSKLPAKATLALLQGPWAQLADTGDYAALWLFQTGKDLVKLCTSKMEADPAGAAAAFPELLAEKCKEAHFMKAAEFAAGMVSQIPVETLQKLHDLAKAQKMTKAVKLLTPALEPREEKAEEAPSDPELAYLQGVFNPFLLKKIWEEHQCDKKLKTEKILMADGKTEAPEFLVQCAIAPYLASYEAPQHISGYQSDTVKVKFLPDADRAAALLDRESLLAALKTGWEKNKTFHAILLPYGRYCSGTAITELQKNMNGIWKDWYRSGVNGRTRIIVARSAMLLSDTREAMLNLEKACGLREYAALRGTDAEELKDRVMCEFGLDANGCKVYDLGTKTVQAVLNRELSIDLYDGDKVIKSIPKKGTDPDKAAAAAADLSDLKKNMKKVVKARNDQLFAEFLRPVGRRAASWLGSYTGNALLRTVARLVVWQQGSATFLLDAQGKPITSEEKPYAVTEEPIRVAHPMEMGEGDISRWQEYFRSHGLKQPFQQIWEPKYDLSAIPENRYDNCEVLVYRFKNGEKHGITFEDYNFHEEVYFNLMDCACEYERTFTGYSHEIGKEDMFVLGKFSVKKQSRYANHIVYLLDSWTSQGRVRKDDVAVVEVAKHMTAAQVMELLNLAIEVGAPNCTAALMELKNNRFPDYSQDMEFLL